MKYYSQKDSRWSNIFLGNSQSTIGKYGCFLTSISMIAEIEPTEINKTLTDNGCIDNNGSLSSQCAANILKIEYNGKTFQKPNYICIAETDFYKNKGVPQHFFIVLENGQIVDPLDLEPKPKNNKYPIVSYRLFKGEDMDRIDVARAIAITRLGNPFQNEVDYIIREFIDKGRSLEEYARQNAVRDSLIPNIWIASEGTDCPINEINFWDIYFRDHGDCEGRNLAYQWYKDHVIPKSQDRDNKINELNKIVENYQKQIIELQNKPPLIQEKPIEKSVVTYEDRNFINDVIKRMKDAIKMPKKKNS